MEGRFFSYSDDPFVPGSSRIKRSPKPRRKHQVNGCPGDAEKDRLITTDSDGTYRRPPGVHNSAYIGCPVRGADPSPLEAGWGGSQGEKNEQRWLVLQGQWGCEVGWTREPASPWRGGVSHINQGAAGGRSGDKLCVFPFYMHALSSQPSKRALLEVKWNTETSRSPPPHHPAFSQPDSCLDVLVIGGIFRVLSLPSVSGVLSRYCIR